jgi:hypothetical protein
MTVNAVSMSKVGICKLDDPIFVRRLQPSNLGRSEPVADGAINNE